MRHCSTHQPTCTRPAATRPPPQAFTWLAPLLHCCLATSQITTIGATSCLQPYSWVRCSGWGLRGRRGGPSGGAACSARLSARLDLTPRADPPPPTHPSLSPTGRRGPLHPHRFRSRVLAAVPAAPADWHLAGRWEEGGQRGGVRLPPVVGAPGRARLPRTLDRAAGAACVHAGTLPLIFSLLGDLFDSSRRAGVSSVVQLSTGVGLAVGQGIAGLVGERSRRLGCLPGAGRAQRAAQPTPSPRCCPPSPHHPALAPACVCRAFARVCRSCLGLALALCTGGGAHCGGSVPDDGHHARASPRRH